MGYGSLVLLSIIIQCMLIFFKGTVGNFCNCQTNILTWCIPNIPICESNKSVKTWAQLVTGVTRK